MRPNGFRLSFQLDRLEHIGLDGVANDLEGRLADQHLAWLGRLLQSGGDIDSITGRQPLLRAGHDLASVDPYSPLESELRQCLPHLERRTAGAEGVVLVRRRNPEDGHHGVADELLDAAPVTLDDLLHSIEVASQQCAEGLRIGRLTHRGRADDVAEEHRHDLALEHARPSLGRANPDYECEPRKPCYRA
jgi:hypothetical protein